MTIAYYYFQNRTPGATQKGGPLNLSPTISPLPDKRNPLYNFSQDFITQFQNVAPGRMASALPYISLCTLDDKGNVLTDFNLQFLTKSVNMNNVKSQTRYADRPEISLQSLTVSQDLAAGGGTMAWTNVTLQFKLHKPDYITNNSLVSLLFSGLPMRITYGWASDGSKDDFLGVNDVLLFNVRDYTIDFDVAGQAMLTINGMGHGDSFANVFVGDTAQLITKEDVQDAANDGPVTNIQQDDLHKQLNRINTYVSYVNSIPVRSDAKGQRDIKIIDSMTRAYYDVSDRASIITRANFSSAMERLAAKKTSYPQYFTDVKKANGDGTTSFAEAVTLHDVISVLCAPTLNALQGPVIPANREYRFVYGCFNENAGSWAGKCIARCPIHWRSFNAMLSAVREKIPVPSLQWIFNGLTDSFLSSQSYWRDNLLRNQSQDFVDYPSVACQVTTHFGDDPNKEIVQIAFFDVSRNVPLTQLQLKNVKTPTTEAAQIAACIGNPPQIPIIKFGSANSFVRNIKMESLLDPAFKALLMNNEDNSVTTTRQSVTAGAVSPPPTENPPFIPFKGSMDVIGHIDWKPARYFYLSSGIFFIDGVYTIMKVSQTLDSTGFKTHLEFSRH